MKGYLANIPQESTGNHRSVQINLLPPLWHCVTFLVSSLWVCVCSAFFPLFLPILWGWPSHRSNHYCRPTPSSLSLRSSGLECPASSWTSVFTCVSHRELRRMHPKSLSSFSSQACPTYWAPDAFEWQRHTQLPHEKSGSYLWPLCLLGEARR